MRAQQSGHTRTLAQIIHQPTFEILEDPDIQRKKTRFFEAEISGANFGILFDVFERFAFSRSLKFFLKLKKIFDDFLENAFCILLLNDFVLKHVWP